MVENKGKYGDLIKKAREPENQKTRKPENQKTSKPANQQTSKPENQINTEIRVENLEFPDINIGQEESGMKGESQKLKELKSQKISQPENQIKSNLPEIAVATKEREVNLSVKVPLSWRRHWAAEAKREGVTMTEVMTNALKVRFGLPD